MKGISIVLALLMSITMHGQTYFNEIIETVHDRPLFEKVHITMGKYIVPYDYSTTLDGTKSAILQTDINITEEILIDSLNLGLNPLIWVEGNPYLVGENPISPNDTKIACTRLTPDFENQVWYKEYDTPGYSTINSGFTNIGNNIYILNVNRINQTPNIRYGQLLKIDTIGEQAWSINLGEDGRYSYATELLRTQDDQLLVSQLQGFPNDLGVYVRLYKIDEEGDIQWEYIGEEDLVNGGSPLHMAELSDRTIVVSAVLEKGFDPIFIQNDWYPIVTQFVWLDQAGNRLHDTLLITDYADDYNINGLEKGKGNYFYAYGSRRKTDEAGQDDNHNGLITKYSNTGDTIWTHLYKYPDHLGADIYHGIKNIVELENGDLVVLGETRTFEEGSKIWLFKVNAAGCFGAESCDWESILTATEAKEEKREGFSIYPNPSDGQFYFEEQWLEEIRDIRVYDILGHQVYYEEQVVDNKIRLDKQLSGMYTVHIRFQSGNSWMESIIILQDW